ncbi:glycoside hydrolase family 93 protein [Hypoxylon trugodes]|uniref:glycoside hydrolase family 93 protein n=1 Tax=Hypoxylon trugodes TaxID=326681 RepID=UPI00219D960B|nr:glycoside hydrolase family 93 protein [Hypoxylon trugodes]KAI1390619.1 glycoside hydrolase family 93 protein [Hypoxylon trugodes]
MARLSLSFILLSCLSFISLISSSPIGRVGDASKRRSPSPLGITARDTTTQFNEIGASFTLGSAESKVSSGGTYPRLARLSDGGVLSIATTSSNGEKVLVVSRSGDDGATFSQIGEVARSTGDLDNGFLLQLSSGTILAAFRNHDLDSSGARTYYRITICRSTDGGVTWTFAAQAAEQAATSTPNGLWEPFLRVGKDGRVQLTYSGELAANNQETFRALSSDEGSTWTTPVNLQLHGSQTVRDGMQGIVSTKDAGTGQDALVMVFEVGDGLFHLATVTSYDDGNTWGSRSDIYRTSQHNAGAPQIASINNNLAVVFMTDEDRAVSELDWPNKADIKMIFSTELRNGQVTWTTETLHLSDQASYWPGTFQRATNDIMAVYERGGIPYGKIISAA